MNASFLRRRVLVTTLALGFTTLAPVPALAQGPSRVEAQLRAVAPTEIDRRNAEQVRNDFRELMRQYPPALGEVLKLDPALMTNTAYLQTYPALGAFLTAHPEVPRYPDFFLEFVRTSADRQEYSAERQSLELVRNMMESISIGTVMAGLAFTLTWLIRHLLAHRRWLRATRLQMDIHNKLMERLTTSGEVQAYLESATTNRFLADVPLMSDGGSRLAAPVGRILWSVQAGIVLAAAGMGLMMVRRYLPEAQEALILPGVLAISVGLGFALAAAASYILSTRLGLFDSSTGHPSPTDRA